jgi:D-aspartate ligase
MIHPDRRFFEQFKEPIAFILGIYPTSNLGAVRNLGRKGVQTMVLDTKRNQAAFFSKYAKGILCPHPKYSEEKYINFLLNLGEQLPIKGILFPTGDTETLAILRHRNRLEKYYHFTMADYDVVNSLINKQQFYHLLENYNIPHPKTFFPQDEQDIQTVSKYLSYPCIVKPVYPTYFRLDFHTKLFIAFSQEEIFSLYAKAHEKHHEVMLQEIIPGDAETMYGFNAYYDRTCLPHGKFMYQRIREWPLGFGNGCYIQQVREPVLEQITSFLMQHLGYYGIVDAEFKYDSRDGNFKFIEVNPRLWMQNSYPSRYGNNLPYMAYLEAIGKAIPEKTSSNPRKNIKWVYFLEDIQSSRAGLTTGLLSIHQWVQAYRFRNEHAVFSWDDPLPFFLLGWRSISSLFSTLLEQVDIKNKSLHM